MIGRSATLYMSKALNAYIIHRRILPDGSVHKCGMGVDVRTCSVLVRTSFAD